MTPTQFNLSEKRQTQWIEVIDRWIYMEEDVKEFIRRLKEKLRNYKGYNWQFEGAINSLAGGKLI